MAESEQTWPKHKIGDLLQRVVRPVDVDKSITYREIGIRSHCKGIFHKPEVTGEQIGNKRVFWVEPGCFVVNIVFAWEQAIAVTSEAENGMIASHRFPMYKPTNGKLLPEYAYLYFSSPRGKYELGLASPGGAGRNKTLGQEEFKRLRIPVPPVEYQQLAIDIIKTWKRGIDQTRELIETKQNLKKGLMQQLLTGKVRFPGYIEPWKEYRISKLLKQVRCPVQWDDNSKYQLLSVRRRSEGIFVRETILGKQIKTKVMFQAKYGDFLISKMQVTHGASALVTKEFDGMNISGSYIVLRSKDESKLDIRFFNYLSQTPYMYHLAYLSSYGVHIEKMTFNLQLYLKSKIFIPNSIEEQVKIISVLDSINREIKVLDNLWINLEEERRGLMQKIIPR